MKKKTSKPKSPTAKLSPEGVRAGATTIATAPTYGPTQANAVPNTLAGIASKPPETSPEKLSGSSAVYSYGGRLVSFENNPKLVGRNLFTTFDNVIANTCIVGAAIRYFGNLVAGTSWAVEPKQDTDSDKMAQRAADIVTAGLFESPMTAPWSSVAKRAALYRYYGFSIHEWCVRRRPSDGMIVYKDIEHRPQSTVDLWDIPPEGGPFKGVVQLVPMRPEYFYVPRDRMLYCADNALTDQPNGIGLLRHVVEHARRLERYEQLEGFGFEGDLRGMPVGRIPGAELAAQSGLTGAAAEAYVEAQAAGVHRLVRNHIKTPFQGIVLDSATYIAQAQSGAISAVPKWAVEIVRGDKGPLLEMNSTIERINREIARVLGMEFLLLGADGSGSLAMSRDKTSMFATVMESTLAELAWFTTHDLVYPLLELNGIDPELYCPQINPDPIATERIEAVVAALVGLAQAGAPLMPDDPAINQIRSRLHLAEQPKLTPEVLGTIMRAKFPDPTKAPPPGSKPPGDGEPKDTAPKSQNPDNGTSDTKVDPEGRAGGATPSAKVSKRRESRTLFRRVEE